MVHYKSATEIEAIRRSCLLVCDTLALVASELKAGVTGLALDALAEANIRSAGAVPGFLGYGGFPNTLCISRNACVVHGIPDAEPFVEGDIVSIDCGVKMDGFFGDAAYTFAIGEIEEATMALLYHTKQSLHLAIEQARVGNRMGDVGAAVQEYCEKEHGYGVVRELVGHGIGAELHERPEVPNYGKRGRGPKLKKGLVIAIEPMVNLGTRSVVQMPDGWTILTKDRKPSAHYEHSVAVVGPEADVLSDHGRIEEAIKKNPSLSEISIKK
ncbi:MAG: type I methionyl aminopeptidase [Saprospiraceae bacterium]|nr:type I methionyl aminopeptidase [Saprospiraceae bacterium]